MVDGLLLKQVRDDADIAGMLTEYKSRPAFFYQKSPADTDEGWQKPCYPRADYNIDMRYDPERKVSGTLIINVWCVLAGKVMPEDIEKRLIALISGTFYTGEDRTTVCAIWSRSDAYDFEARGNAGGNTAPEGTGVTVSFDLMEFPMQITANPDPIQGLNAWTKENLPDMTVITHDNMPDVWKPTDANPAIYWRFEGASVSDRQTYAVDWYTGRFAAHVVAESVTERNRWMRALMEEIQLWGEVVLTDGSPMFAQQITVRHNADPLREGQLMLTGKYGVLTQPRKDRAAPTLNRATFTGIADENPQEFIGMEVTANGTKIRKY